MLFCVKGFSHQTLPLPSLQANLLVFSYSCFPRFSFLYYFVYRCIGISNSYFESAPALRGSIIVFSFIPKKRYIIREKIWLLLSNNFFSLFFVIFLHLEIRHFATERIDVYFSIRNQTSRYEVFRTDYCVTFQPILRFDFSIYWNAKLKEVITVPYELTISL